MPADGSHNQWRDELLSRLNPSVKPRIAGNADYEDLVALLAAWLQATDEHLGATEEKVVSRLSSELAPAGDWKFPAQTLAIPVELKPRFIDEDTRFQGSGGKDDQWRPCGNGWTRPTALQSAQVVPVSETEFALVCEIRTDKPGTRVLLSEAEATPAEGQQLAFVCGDDDLVSALGGAKWAIQHRGETAWEPVTVTRYYDYLRFERGLGGARQQQRQLAAWIPPLYPYSRKILRFALEEPGRQLPSSEWEHLGSGGEFSRLAVRIDEKTAIKIESMRVEQVEAAKNPIILNPVPVAQMQFDAEELLGSPFRTSDGYSRPFTGVWGTFAATVQESFTTETGTGTIYPPASLRVGKADFNALRQDEQTAVIGCGAASKSASSYFARLYYGCRGHETASPRELSRGPQVFSTPFPALGGASAPNTNYGDAGARHAWYHAYLKSQQPTEADIIEIINQVPTCREYLMLGEKNPRSLVRQRIITLDIDNQPRAQRNQWENYLWPTQVSEDTLLEMRASFLSASEVAIMPLMKLHLKKRKKELPEFLWREFERFTASLISQFFMVGWYRLEAVVGDE